MSKAKSKKQVEEESEEESEVEENEEEMLGIEAPRSVLNRVAALKKVHTKYLEAEANLKKEIAALKSKFQSDCVSLNV